VYNISLISYYQKAYYNKISVPFCSETIYDLIDYTNNNKGKYFSADWGIHNQLIAFNQDKEKFKEIYKFFLNKRTLELDKLFYENYLIETDDEHFFILRAKGAEFNANAKNRLLSTAGLFGIELKEHKRFFDQSEKKDIFVIYGIE